MILIGRLILCTGSASPLILNGQDLKLVSLKVNGKALEVFCTHTCYLNVFGKPHILGFFFFFFKLQLFDSSL